MIPQTVTFSGLTLNPSEFLVASRLDYWPSDWTIHRFTANGFFGDDGTRLETFVNGFVDGPWDYYHFYSDLGIILVMAFANANDAVMFRLNDGETAWRNE